MDYLIDSQEKLDELLSDINIAKYQKLIYRYSKPIDSWINQMIGLIELDVTGNHFDSLDYYPNSVKIIRCYRNNFEFLYLKSGIIILECEKSIIPKLCLENTSLPFLYCSFFEIYTIGYDQGNLFRRIINYPNFDQYQKQLFQNPVNHEVIDSLLENQITLNSMTKLMMEYQKLITNYDIIIERYYSELRNLTIRKNSIRDLLSPIKKSIFKLSQLIEISRIQIGNTFDEIVKQWEYDVNYDHDTKMMIEKYIDHLGRYKTQIRIIIELDFIFDERKRLIEFNDHNLEFGYRIQIINLQLKHKIIQFELLFESIK